MHKKRAYWRDVLRSVTKGKKRFISIALIAALGVTMMCGLRAACVDLRYSADQFFDEQNLFDIRILSTLGLTDEDLKALETLDEVKAVDGGYSESVYTKVGEMQRSIEIRTLSEKNFNQPYLLEGRLPEKPDEIVITENYEHQSGKNVGDRIVLEKEAEYLKSDTYTITGIIIDALDINSSEGAMGFRSTSATDYVGYVIPEAADSEVYSVIYVSLKGTEKLNCYTDEYEEKVEQVVDKIDSEIKTQREQARYDEVHGEAMSEWLDGEQEMKEEFAKADAEIADARQEIREARQRLEDARQEFEDGKQKLVESRQQWADGKAELDSQAKKAAAEFAGARKEIEDGYAEIASGKEELAQAYKNLLDGQAQLDARKAELTQQQTAAEVGFAAARQPLTESEAELQAGYAEYEAGKQQLEESRAMLQPQIDAIESQLANPELSDEQRAQLEALLARLKEPLEQTEAELAAVRQQLTESEQQLEAGKAELAAQEEAVQEQFAAAWAAIDANQAEIDVGMEQYESGMEELEAGEQQLAAGEARLRGQEDSAWAQIEAGYKELKAGEKELEDGEKELADGEKELADGEKELADGEQELAENEAEYEEEKAKAEKELADAREEIDDIDMTKWYVQARSALSGYSNIKSDAASIQAIGDVFPVLFLTVAILISLTTITRLVEEERGLIGTYKALGFSNGEIRRKYVIYAALACLIGGLIGDIGGYMILPAIIFIVFRVMYILPEYAFQFDMLYGFGGILLFEAGIVGAAAYTCRRTLKKMPARLMRPKPPKTGSRVVLERIAFIWKRLSFLNKVTARNLFRYKKRLLMTVSGITGCMALLLCGFTIKNTISEMMPQQYENIYKYDLMAVAADDEFDKLKDALENDKEIEAYVSVRIESLEVINEQGQKETVQLIAVPGGSMLDSYICLKDRENQVYELKDGDIFLTRNAAQMLGFEEGDTVTWQNLDLTQVEAPITRIVENYLGNMVYMTEKTYTELFGNYEVNGALAFFSEKCEDQAAYADELARQDGILSAMSTEAMEAEFDPAFALINMVVYVILVLAAMLAFVVLFTLSNTNISERVRELATIKVLGFYNYEVHSYVNKETLILTSIGILFGMPAGYLFGRYLMGILEFPSLQFYIILYPESYLTAAAITMIFALIVNFITNRILDKINMVEALKSVE